VLEHVESLAVGFFDGVHLGHQKILRGATAALTFRNHPQSLLMPERAPRLIMTPEAREQAIRACGVERVTMVAFTRQVAEMPPAEFLKKYVFVHGDVRPGWGIRCGENWRFGKGGLGDVAFVRRSGVEVEVVPYAEYKGERISSTRIRACLERGEIEDANAMMGRRFELRGTREEGKGLGRQLGYPTINLRLSTSTCNLNLPQGVYEVEMNGERGVANYGLAPTLGAEAWRDPVLEVHLLGSRSSSADRPPPTSAVVEIVRFLRPERKFASVEELKRQIAADCAAVACGAKGGAPDDVGALICRRDYGIMPT